MSMTTKELLLNKGHHLILLSKTLDDIHLTLEVHLRLVNFSHRLNQFKKVKMLEKNGLMNDQILMPNKEINE